MIIHTTSSSPVAPLRRHRTTLSNGSLWQTTWNNTRGSILLLGAVVFLKFYIVDEPRELAVSIRNMNNKKQNNESNRKGIRTNMNNNNNNDKKKNNEAIETKTNHASFAVDPAMTDTSKEGNHPTDRASVTGKPTKEEDSMETRESVPSSTDDPGYQAIKSGRSQDSTLADAIPVVTQSKDDEVKEAQQQENITTTAKNNNINKGHWPRFANRPALSLLGERHSGTNWMNVHLKDCFGESVRFRQEYSDWKHWFQVEDDRYKEMGAVVVAQFRNVYHWTEAMRNNPHHSPLHFYLDWTDFVNKTWTMPRYKDDLAFVNVNQKTSPPNIFCLHARNKRPYELIPCRANRSIVVESMGNNKRRKVEALYELRDDGSGLPYDNILELRSAKIRNLLRVQHFSNVKSFHSIHYEDLVEQGTQELIDTLEQDLNVTANCVPLKGQSNMGTRPLMDDFVEYMKHHVDWTTEALIGYGPETLF